MSEIVVSVLSSIGAASLLVFLLRNWLAERLRQGIQHEYDEKLEHLKATLVAENALLLERAKADLSRDASVLAVAHRSLGESAAMAHQRRLDGVSELWKAMLNVRNNSPAILTFLDVLLPDEYANLHERQFKTIDPDVPPSTLQEMAGATAKTIEQVRPFVGDYLWLLFYVYQAIHIRIVFLYMNSRASGIYKPWYQDEPTIKLLGAVASEDEMRTLQKLRVSQIHSMRQLIESKFLTTSERIISGQTTGIATGESAARIAREIAEFDAKSAAALVTHPVIGD